MKTTIFLFFLFILFLTTSYGRNTYYFSSSKGNDSNDGLSPSSAKQTLSTLQALLNTSKPGDKFLLKRGDTWETRAGNFGIEINNVNGNSQNYITIDAYDNGEKPVFDFSGTAAEIYFKDGSSNSYIKIRNIKFTTTASEGNKPYWGIWEYSSNSPHVIIDSIIVDGLSEGVGINKEYDWQITNSFFTNTWAGNSQSDGGEALFLNDCSHIVLKNSLITNNLNSNWRSHFIYISNSSDSCIIENNIMHDGFGGISVVDGYGNVVRNNIIYNCSSGAGISLDSRPQSGDDILEGFLCEKNKIYNCQYGIGIRKSLTGAGMEGQSHTSNGIIINNVIYNCTGTPWSYGLLIENSQDTYNLTLSNILLANNTIVNCSAGAVGFGAGYVQYNSIEIKNNIFYNTYSSAAEVWIKNTQSLPAINLDHNLYYSTNGGSDLNVEGISFSLSQFKVANILQEVNGISGNPQFTNLSGFDFSINENSPAVDRGLTLSNVTDDFNGNLRPAGAGYDIGAYEYGATSGLIPTQDTELNIKIFLEGPFINGNMLTDLLVDNYISLTQPYLKGPWNYGGTESVTSVPAGVVDWILLELRSGTSSSTIVARRAAFVKNDGSVVDLDGTSEVSFNGVSNGNYYVVVMHRNHLPVMSANAIPLSSNSPLYDFTTSPSQAFGTDALANLGGGKWGMYAGDSDTNGIINVLDYGNVSNFLFDTGYRLGDLDLNGVVNVLDYSKSSSNLLKSSQVPN